MLTQDQMALIARAKGWKSTSVQSKAAIPYVEIIEDLEKQLNDREAALADREAALAAEQSELKTKIAELEAENGMVKAQLAKKEAENTMITAQRDSLLTEKTREDFALSSQVQTKAAADAQPNDGPSTVAQTIESQPENVTKAVTEAPKFKKPKGYGEKNGWCCVIVIDGVKWNYRLEQKETGGILFWTRIRWDFTTKKRIREYLSVKKTGFTVENPPPEVLRAILNGEEGKVIGR